MTHEIEGRNSGVANVIVVLYNSESTLEALVAGLDSNRDSIAQVTLVDNGSSDGSATMARELLAGHSLPGGVIESTNSGFAGGHWAARDSFDDPLLPTLCLNPDVSLAAGALADMLDVLGSTPEAAIVTATLVGTDGAEDSALRRRLPTVTSGALYSVLGKLLPGRLRYNSQATERTEQVAGFTVSSIEATTGALMLISPTFCKVTTGIFDRDYFMYGEDLQICLDAKLAGRRVLLVEREPSIHVKGVSSGFPRSWRSNQAFHEALTVYYRKNLARTRIDAVMVRLAVWCRLMMTGGAGAVAKAVTRKSA